MKKYLAVAAMIGILCFLSYSLVNARGNHGYGPGMGYGDGDGYGCCNNLPVQDQDNEKVAAFLAETKETRKQLAVKRSERRALMSQDNPDEKKVANLTGEIFDLKNLLDEKARGTFGNTPPFSYGGARGGFGNCGRGPRN